MTCCASVVVFNSPVIISCASINFLYYLYDNDHSEAYFWNLSVLTKITVKSRPLEKIQGGSHDFTVVVFLSRSDRAFHLYGVYPLREPAGLHLKIIKVFIPNGAL